MLGGFFSINCATPFCRKIKSEIGYNMGPLIQCFSMPTDVLILSTLPSLRGRTAEGL